MTEREEYCLKLLDGAGLPKRKTDHCRAVALLAAELARRLRDKGYTPDISLCLRGGLLHDIRRMERRHARAGAVYLESIGLTDEARICALHDGEDISLDLNDEAAIVCLADKLLSGAEYVGIQKRYEYTAKKYSHDPALLRVIARRRTNAYALQTIVEAALGKSVFEIWREVDTKQKLSYNVCTENPEIL